MHAMSPASGGLPLKPGAGTPLTTDTMGHFVFCKNFELRIILIYVLEYVIFLIVITILTKIH